MQRFLVAGNGLRNLKDTFLLEGRGCQRAQEAEGASCRSHRWHPLKKRPKPLSSEPWMANGDALRELETSGEKGHNTKALEAPERKVNKKQKNPTTWDRPRRTGVASTPIMAVSEPW